MEQDVIARLAALEFIVERFIASEFASRPPSAVHDFAARCEELAHQLAAPPGIPPAAAEAVVALQAGAVADAITHRVVRLVQRTEAIRSGG